MFWLRLRLKLQASRRQPGLKMGNGVEFKEQFSEEDMEKAKEILEGLYDEAAKKKKLKRQDKKEDNNHNNLGGN